MESHCKILLENFSKDVTRRLYGKEIATRDYECDFHYKKKNCNSKSFQNLKFRCGNLMNVLREKYQWIYGQIYWHSVCSGAQERPYLTSKTSR